MTDDPRLPQSQLPDIQWPRIPSREDARTLALLGQMEQSQWWSMEDILSHQLAQLTLLVRHAASTVAFYQKQLEPFSHFESPTLTSEILSQLPVLRRSDIQSNPQAIGSRSLPKWHTPVVKVSTSGSTGTPIHVLSTPATQLMFRALGLRFHLWHKRDSTQPNMTIRLAPSNTPKVSQGRGWIPCYPPGPAFNYCATLPISELYGAFRKHDPVYLQAYPSIVQELIRRSRLDGVKPQRLRDIRTYGGVLSAELREQCLQEWGVPITDNYSSLEAGIIALQCPQTSCLHVQSENVLAEVVREDGSPCRPGEVGRLLISVLNNFATPLIRYEIGDLVELGNPCPCGRGLLVLNRVVGRDMHLFTLPDGSRVVPYLQSSEFENIAPIRQFQLVQSSLTNIDVNLATERPLTAKEEQDMRQHLRQHLHANFNYYFHYMDQIPRGATGKFEMLRSDV